MCTGGSSYTANAMQASISTMRHLNASGQFLGFPGLLGSKLRITAELASGSICSAPGRSRACSSDMAPEKSNWNVVRLIEV